MKQEINLLAVLPKKEYVKLPAQKMLVFTGWFLLLLICFYVFLLWRSSTLEGRLAAMKQREVTAMNALKAINKKTEIKPGDSKELREVKTLKKQLTESREVIAILKSKSSFNVKGFSEYLAQLAEHTPQDVWLSNIELLKGGSDVVLGGHSFSSHEALDFVSNLNQLAAFHGEKLQFKLASAKKSSVKMPESPVENGESAQDEKKEPEELPVLDIKITTKSVEHQSADDEDEGEDEADSDEANR